VGIQYKYNPFNSGKLDAVQDLTETIAFDDLSDMPGGAISVGAITASGTIKNSNSAQGSSALLTAFNGIASGFFSSRVTGGGALDSFEIKLNNSTMINIVDPETGDSYIQFREDSRFSEDIFMTANKLLYGENNNAGGHMRLSSTSHATKGNIYIGSAETNYYDEANDAWQLGAASITTTGIAGASSLDLGVTGATTGVLRMDGATSGVVTIQPAATAGTYTLTLPATDGDASQYLQTDGDGALSWATVDLSGYVPYSNATGAVDLNAQNLTNVGTLGAGAITGTSLDAGSGAITTTGTVNNDEGYRRGILMGV